MVAKHRENLHFKQHVFLVYPHAGCLIPDESPDVRFEGMNVRGTDKRSEYT